MSLSYCQKCGNKFETRGFKCPHCGALLAYSPQPRRGPSFWDRLKPYRNYLILLAIAIIIASTRAALALTTIYWALLGAAVVAVAILYLRGRNRTQGSSRPPYGPPTRGSGYSPPQNRYGAPGRPGPGASQQKRHGNVIPFRKKRDSKQNDAKGQ